MSASSSFAEKERDNTWLQVAVCPSRLRPGERCPTASDDQKSPGEGDPDRCAYAHPPDHVMKHVLSNGYVVSCHDFVFSHSTSSVSARRGGCSRTNCKYFHPPTHLRLLVINAGKNNKRLRSELMTSLQQQQQQQQAVLASAMWKQQQQPASLASHQPSAAVAAAAAATPTLSLGQVVPSNMLQASHQHPYYALPSVPALQYPTASSLLLAAAAASSPTSTSSGQETLPNPVNIREGEPDPPGTSSSTGQEAGAFVSRKRNFSHTPCADEQGDDCGGRDNAGVGKRNNSGTMDPSKTCKVRRSSPVGATEAVRQEQSQAAWSQYAATMAAAAAAAAAAATTQPAATGLTGAPHLQAQQQFYPLQSSPSVPAAATVTGLPLLGAQQINFPFLTQEGVASAPLPQHQSQVASAPAVLPYLYPYFKY